MEHLDFLFERIDKKTELMSKTRMGLYQANGLTDVLTCKLLEGISKQNKTNKKAKRKQTNPHNAGRKYKIY